MSVSVTRSEGTTVLTLTSDQSSACPPLCQLLGALCYSPRLCSLPRHVTRPRVGAQSVLGALWIITASLHIGLGVLLLSDWRTSTYTMRDTYCPVWLGVVFLILGVGCVLSERFPRPVLVLLSGLLNLVGVALSITAIVLYCIDIQYPDFYFSCQPRRENSDVYLPREHRRGHDYYWYDDGATTTTAAPTTTTADPDEGALESRCAQGRDLMWRLVISVRSVLVLLSVLNLSLGLSSAVLSFKSLRKHKSESQYKPVAQETTEQDRDWDQDRE